MLRVSSLVPLPLADILCYQLGLHQDQHPHHPEGNRQGPAILHVRHLGSHRARQLVEHRGRHHAAGQVPPHPVKLDRQWLLHRLGHFRCPLQDRLRLRRAVRPSHGYHLDATSMDPPDALQVKGLDSGGAGPRCSVSLEWVFLSINSACRADNPIIQTVPLWRP